MDADSMISVSAPLDKYEICTLSMSVWISVWRVIYEFWGIRGFIQISMD